MAEPDIQRKLSAIMFTDIVGYTKMMEQNEASTLAFLNFHDTLVRMEIADNGGKVIKTVGDAFLADFSSAVNAVQCAISIQRRFIEYNKSTGVKRQLRIGIHIGDVVISNNDIFGDGVNIASRLQAIAEPGGICISEDVYHHIKNMIEYQVVFQGSKDLKNLSRKVETYRIVPDVVIKRKFARPKRSKAFGVFLFLVFLAVLAAGWYFFALSGGQAWLSTVLPSIIPPPEAVPTAVLSPVGTSSPTPAETQPAQLAVAAAPLATPTCTPTATPKLPVKRPAVKKKAKVKTKVKTTLHQKVTKPPVEVVKPRATQAVPPPFESAEPPSAPPALPTQDVESAPPPSNSEPPPRLP